MGRKAPVRFLAALAVLAAAAAPALACPFCDAAVGDTGEATTNAYFVSILFMLAMPFALGGGIAALLWRASRKRPPAAALPAAGREPAAPARAPERDLVEVP